MFLLKCKGNEILSILTMSVKIIITPYVNIQVQNNGERRGSG